jgi:hypothetical protein
MTDLEMLELAAKAAGLTGECHLLTGDCSDPAEPGGFRYEHPDGGHDWWNPLMDDGDALRLAADLDMILTFSLAGFARACSHGGMFDVDYSNDRCSAMRRAITIAAAQIGKVAK